MERVGANRSMLGHATRTNLDFNSQASAYRLHFYQYGKSTVHVYYRFSVLTVYN